MERTRGQPDSRAATWPGVSVVMAIRAGERHLQATVRQVLRQDYPGPLELVVVLGPARDRTERVALAIAATDPRVRLVEAPEDRASGALASAIREATYDVIVRVDGRGMLGPGYLRRAVEVLEGTSNGEQHGSSAAVAAGRESAFGEAVVRAMASRLGIDRGDRDNDGSRGSRRTNGRTGPMDTVYLGVFRRGDRTRDGQVHHAGGTVWFTPEMRVTYRPQPTPRTLAQQFYLNGQWQHALRRRYPGAFKGRAVAAPLAAITCLLGLVVCAVGLLAMSPPLVVGGLAIPVLCLITACLGAAFAGRGLSAGGKLWLPVTLLITHLAWGAGFLTSPPFLGHQVVGRSDTGTAGGARIRHHLTTPTNR
ncbi:glycosyltransferase [Actinopolymorpha sp. B9G3]|uniref:glycosyltransferase n=1 Tax=Actinopolymorpha sp. B9G3 TaxID=3158970 RepID=UPI0032D95C76